MNILTLPDEFAISETDSVALNDRPLFSQPPRLTEGAVGIRRFEPGDAPALFSAVRESYQELSTWMVWCRPNYSLTDCEEFIASCDDRWEKGESYNFAIFDAVDGSFAGSIALNQINRMHNFANIGYWVRSTRSGCGIGTAAVRLISRFGFLKLQLSRLEMVVQMENHSSRRVAEKVGANREGILQNRLLMHGKACNAFLYSLLAEKMSLETDVVPADRVDMELAWIR